MTTTTFTITLKVKIKVCETRLCINILSKNSYSSVENVLVSTLTFGNRNPLIKSWSFGL